MIHPIDLCACLGPQGKDEFCPCTMRQMGKKPDFPPVNEEELKKALARIFPKEQK